MYESMHALIIITDMEFYMILFDANSTLFGHFINIQASDETVNLI